MCNIYINTEIYMYKYNDMQMYNRQRNRAKVSNRKKELFQGKC